MTQPHDPLYEPHLDGQDGDLDGGPGERVAKALARAGVASRREVERLIEAGRVAINGKVLTTPAVKVAPGDFLTVDGQLVAEREPTRIFRYHKPTGLMTTHNDPKGRPTVFQSLPKELPPSLDVALVADTPPSAFPNGCHIAEVEIDPETGVIEVVKYSMVNDFGTLLNPMLVEGQAHGGVVQGIGQALLEATRYDDEGQLLTGSYMDYALPRADNTPSFLFASHPVPAKTNVLGVKGCGEAGVAGSLPAVMNAVVDALSTCGIRHIDMPATPERVWRAIHEARAA